MSGLRLAAHLRESDGIEASPADGRFVHTSLGPIYAIPAGPLDGPTVLLIHGSVGWSGTWRHTLETLGDAGYLAIAMDVPPMWFSTRDPDGDYGRAMTADRIDVFSAAVGLRPHLVAHSYGAGAAVEAVMRYPNAYASLIIISGALALDPQEATLPTLLRPQWVREMLVSATVTNPYAARPLLQAFLHRDETATDEVLAVLSAPATQAGATSALAQWLPTLLVPPVGLQSTRSSAYPELEIPVAIIWGEQDTTTPLAEGQNLHALIPGSTLTVIPDVGHIPMIEDEAAFEAALIAALAELSSR